MSTSATDFASVVAQDPTVFIVDDDVRVRRAISSLVRSVGLADDSYSSARDYLDHYDPQRAGCLVVDIRMPGMSGLELQRALHSLAGAPPIIFITAHGEVESAVQAVRAGAVDFIQKPFSPDALLGRIREAIELDRLNRRNRAQITDIQERMSRLTSREHEIMRLLAQGETTKQIARYLSISPKTIDNHRASILDKMHVDNPTQLAILVNLC